MSGKARCEAKRDDLVRWGTWKLGRLNDQWQDDHLRHMGELASLPCCLAGDWWRAFHSPKCTNVRIQKLGCLHVCNCSVLITVAWVYKPKAGWRYGSNNNNNNSMLDLNLFLIFCYFFFLFFITVSHLATLIRLSVTRCEQTKQKQVQMGFSWGLITETGSRIVSAQYRGWVF